MAWWLRSPAARSDLTAVVRPFGSVGDHGAGSQLGVRPAFWLDLSGTLHPAVGPAAEEIPESSIMLEPEAVEYEEITGPEPAADEAGPAFSTDLTAGDTLFFGSYEQDEVAGPDPIEWQVLAVEDGRALLLSRCALDSKPYNTERTYVTWESSSLRAWLNGTFLNEAFRLEEQMLIPEVTVSADKNPRYGTDPGNSTSDKIFLLSISEAEQYLDSDKARQAQASEYAKKQGADTFYSVNTWWWLRSPGYDQNFAAYVFYDGSVGYYGSGVDLSSGAVRPALWIDL